MSRPIHISEAMAEHWTARARLVFNPTTKAWRIVYPGHRDYPHGLALTEACKLSEDEAQTKYLLRANPF